MSKLNKVLVKLFTPILRRVFKKFWKTCEFSEEDLNMLDTLTNKVLEEYMTGELLFFL